MDELSHEIEYRFRFDADDGKQKKELRYTLQVSVTAPVQPAVTDLKPLPAWTALDFNKCPNCPLNSKKAANCPAAVMISPIVADFETFVSYDRLELEVRSGDRRVIVQTDVQKSVSSLMGLYLANSGCPRLDFFRPMAYFHQPLATPEETMFRALASYFLASYFQGRSQTQFDLEPLNVLYEQVQVVNTYLAKRLQESCKGDASQNAVVLLHLLSCIMPDSLDHSLQELRPLFRSIKM